MTSVLGILQTAANRIGIPAPAAYTSNTQLLHLLYDVCQDLRNTCAFRQQVRTHTFNTSSSRASYPLPSDFYAQVRGSQYNRATDEPLIGPADDAVWAFLTEGSGGSLSKYTFQVSGPDLDPSSASGQFTLNPTPDSTQSIGFYYITKHFFVPSTYATASLSETISASTDICIFDDDVLIQGLKYKYKEAKRLDYSDAKQAYERYKESAMSRWHGSTVDRLSRAQSGFGPRYNVTPGGWSL